MKIILYLFLGMMTSLTIQSQTNIQSPKDFLPTDYGNHFTPHHELLNYFEYVAENSDMVELVEYGKTYQDRPLVLAIVTSEANHKQLDAIRINNLRKTGIVEGNVDAVLDKAVVWLSYSVHGNEAGGSESSMQVAYELITDAAKKAWLDNTIVILDPSLNPDGYSRYSHWIRNVAGKMVNTDPTDIEHNEPWPGGRVNHYLYDLNRDWAWLTQVESKSRMKFYNQWLPHIHADIHEQFFNDPYYFAPAAVPYHNYISKFQKDFQDVIGRNHAKYFDEEGWLYFTRENFDLFYPSYGDTYPMFNGAIGMTYEQAGHSRGGRAVMTDAKQVLSLQDRIDHHKTTSLSTIEVASKNVEELVSNFAKYYRDSKNSPQGKYKSYILRSDGDNGKMLKLCQLLDNHEISYGTFSGNKIVRGYSYNEMEQATFQAEEGDMVISAYQPKSVLLQVLLDPESVLEDSITYDITSWALPYAYGFSGVASTEKITPDKDLKIQLGSYNEAQDPYAYIFNWEPNSSGPAAGMLLQNDYVLRFASEGFEFSSQKYRKGTVIVTRADNRDKRNFAAEVPELLRGMKIDLESVESGLTDKGPDFGSAKMKLMKRKDVLTFRGDGVGVNSFGQIHYYFNEELKYPITVVDIDDLKSTDFPRFNIIILPGGSYRLSPEVIEKLSKWIGAGGRLISIGSANNNFLDREGFKLKRYATSEEKSLAEKDREQKQLYSRMNPYDGDEKRFISDYNPGCVVKIKMDTSNPLAYGMDEYYFTLKTNSYTYPLLKGAWNVGYTEEDPEIVGFMGGNVKNRIDNTVTFAVEKKGRGALIYLLDNVLFRSFWENGKDIFTNAFFFGGK